MLLQQKQVLHQCPKGDDLTLKDIENLKRENSLYTNGFQCDGPCKRSYGCRAQAYHCTECAYDLCKECATTKWKDEDELHFKRHKKLEMITKNEKNVLVILKYMAEEWNPENMGLQQQQDIIIMAGMSDRELSKPGLSREEFIIEINSVVNEAFGKLTDDQKKQLVENYGPKLSLSLMFETEDQRKCKNLKPSTICDKHRLVEGNWLLSDETHRKMIQQLKGTYSLLVADPNILNKEELIEKIKSWMTQNFRNKVGISR